MTTDEHAGEAGTPELVSLCSAYRSLNDRRIDLDRRITMLSATDRRDELTWLELEDVLEKLEDATGRLARVSATGLTEVRAKAEVLAILMRSNTSDGGPVVPQDKTQALSLSLADDLAGLVGDGDAAAGRWTSNPPVAVRQRPKSSDRWLLSKYIRPCRNRCH